MGAQNASFGKDPFNSGPLAGLLLSQLMNYDDF
jgi:hypothetical protein